MLSRQGIKLHFMVLLSWLFGRGCVQEYYVTCGPVKLEHSCVCFRTQRYSVSFHSNFISLVPFQRKAFSITLAYFIAFPVCCELTMQKTRCSCWRFTATILTQIIWVVCGSFPFPRAQISTRIFNLVSQTGRLLSG
jgi:hypothetical protein